MDTTDPEIMFDETGQCNHCRRYDEIAREQLHTSGDWQGRLNALVSKIRDAGAAGKYDCVIGVSGGVDSTFLAYEAVRLRLRPLAVHFDNGWDSELAVNNIKVVLDRLGIDLMTRVVDWEEFRDLQRSFLKASVPDAEVPTDHAILALLYQVAAGNRVDFILLGTNVVTETVLPVRWAYGHGDWRYIRSVHRRFGTARLRTTPHMGRWQNFWYRRFRRIRIVPLLNYLPYNKDEVATVLSQELGWRPYGGKHHESIYTRFVQGYLLPRKFGIDKRKAHLSTLICSGQMTRLEALDLLEEPALDETVAREDRRYVIKKLGISEGEFEAMMSATPKCYRDYPNYGDPSVFGVLQPLWTAAKGLVGKLLESATPNRRFDHCG